MTATSTTPTIMIAVEDYFAQRFNAIFSNVDARFELFCAERNIQCKRTAPPPTPAAALATVAQTTRSEDEAASEAASSTTLSARPWLDDDFSRASTCEKQRTSEEETQVDKSAQCARIYSKFDGALPRNAAPVFSAKKQLRPHPPAPAMEPQPPPAFYGFSYGHRRPSIVATGHKMKWTEDTRFCQPLCRQYS